MADELAILSARLAAVAEAQPGWRERLARLERSCRRVGAAVPEPIPTGVHRDFYHDQVLVDRERLWLLDLDLYCLGDPGLDVGNFVAHLTELALRRHGSAEALADREEAMTERFVELAGGAVRPAIRAYAALTLARHVSISAQLPDRRRHTGAILELCEQRLSALEPGSDQG
jgi:aminoglycoside phosphotransferase (APT) family kinase protein